MWLNYKYTVLKYTNEINIDHKIVYNSWMKKDKFINI